MHLKQPDAPSHLTVFGLQKDLLKCKQEARNLQGIKVKRKIFKSLNKLSTRSSSLLVRVGARRLDGSSSLSLYTWWGLWQTLCC